MPDTGPRRPLLISHQDDVSYRLSHLESVHGLDPLSAELDVLRYSQFAQSLSACKTPLDRKLVAGRAARFHALMTHCLQREHISAAGPSVCPPHRHRIDKYLDTLLANQLISDGEATDHCQKGAPQDGGLPELIVARSCLTNHSEAASL